ncbi:phospholipase effector Tle1 domain-containing protein [Xanthomonas fragariae]|uniref:phospholipase effector Tle1 domain-containing protein n=1 Tax=Xanthomonas fragariae TaxID=48664 RepID=UPI00361A170A
MDKKIVLQLGEDGLPLDDVSHYAATPEHLRTYEQAADELYRFKVPQLLDHADPHSYLIVGLMDGTGNDADKDPLHATNVAKFRDKVRGLKDAGVKRIDFEYIKGPGTQDEVLARTVDSATGRTSLARANEMYERLRTQSQQIFQADPQAKIAFHLEGFSRGASQVPLLARMIDERGIPNPKGGISGIDANGLPLYNRYHQAAGLTPMSVGLYDPVPTGYMELFDRRLPPSVVSGFQLSAADERRGLFPVDQILPFGRSADGRFLHVTVAGAHSDIGGSYLRWGMGIRSLNLLTDYHNGLFSEPLLYRMHEPTDPRMNVIHRSEEGNVLFRGMPKMDRTTPAGQVSQLVADQARYAPPGEVVHVPAHAPEALKPEFAQASASARLAQRTAQVADPALTEGHALTAQLLRNGTAELRPYPPPMLDRPGVKAVGALGVAATLYESQQSGEKIATWLSQDNPLAARSELTHFAGRNVGGWAGGTAAAYALGASGAGPMALIAADAYFMSKAGEKAADLLDNRAIYQQTDRQGVQWAFNGTAWSREGMADATNDGSENPNSTWITASYEKARELNYQATTAAAELALRDAPSPQNPYRLSASATDTPSLSSADWMRDPADGQWHRQVKTGVSGANDHGVYAQETAAPARAAQLDAHAEAVIARNIANSLGAIAARYELAYHRSGWAADGLPLSDAMQQALPNPDALTASDGQQYRRDAEGRWAGERGAAAGNVARELDTTRAILQPALAEHAQAVAAIAQLPPSRQDLQHEETLYRYRIVGTELKPEWREAIELATQRTRDTAGLSGDGSMQLQRGPGGLFGADSPIAHFQRGPDGVDRIAAVTSAEDIHQALGEVQARQQAPSQDAPQQRQAQVPPHARWLCAASAGCDDTAHADRAAAATDRGGAIDAERARQRAIGPAAGHARASDGTATPVAIAAGPSIATAAPAATATKATKATTRTATRAATRTGTSAARRRRDDPRCATRTGTGGHRHRSRPAHAALALVTALQRPHPSPACAVCGRTGADAGARPSVFRRASDPDHRGAERVLLQARLERRILCGARYRVCVHRSVAHACRCTRRHRRSKNRCRWRRPAICSMHRSPSASPKTACNHNHSPA